MELVGFGEDLFDQLPEQQIDSRVPLQLACTDTASFAHHATTARLLVPKRSTSAVADDHAAAATDLYQWGTFFYAEDLSTTKPQQERSSAGRPSGDTACAGTVRLALHLLLNALHNVYS
jgi:hypothetical protein